MQNYKRFFIIFIMLILTACGSSPKQQIFAQPDAYQLWNLENPDLYAKSYIFFTKAPLGGFYLGCNRFNFNWRADAAEQSINFDNIMSTRMACEENYEEQKNVEKLMRVNRYEINQNKMQFFEDEELLFDLVLHSKSDSFFNKRSKASNK